jgi:hypothetical protein
MNESLVVRPGGDAHSLGVHQPVVPYTEHQLTEQKL